MAICECGEEFSDKRKKLGYTTCLECGDIEAIEDILYKAKCVAPAYNKGPLTYIYSRQDAHDAGK